MGDENGNGKSSMSQVIIVIARHPRLGRRIIVFFLLGRLLLRPLLLLLTLLFFLVLILFARFSFVFFTSEFSFRLLPNELRLK